jgi:DNA repair protein RecN (Recombination protein N)
MLEKLKATNLSLLDAIEINFSEGLNIATGETGAGKSLILNTLVFFIVKKFPKELIKNKEKETFISIDIRLDSKKIKKILLDNGFEISIGDVFQITRKISSSNLTKYYINNTKIKYEIVSGVFENYFSFFMQGTQSLLVEKKFQHYILDKYAEIEDILGLYKNIYGEYLECSRKYKTLIIQKNNIDEKRDFFRFQLEELRKISIENADEELTFIEEVKNQKVINENKELVNELIAEIDNNAMNAFSSVEKKISKLNLSNENIVKIASDLRSNLSELSYLVSSLSSNDSIHESFDSKQDQLYLLKDLRRKYKLTTDQLIEKRQEIVNLFACESDIDKMIDIAAIERDNTKKSCIEKAIIISNKRKKVGIELSQLIKKGLVDLGIPHATWLVSFRETDISETGIDDIEFMFTANPDFPPEPLKSVASGGELSRIMLILALEISKVFESKIVLFDEPDVGLGGAVAEKLGEKIAQLSKSSQVVCVSHLPQVASFADTHFLISKKLENGKTYISINNLSKDQRVAEIARMLSGTKIEDEALVLARKMVR